MHVPFLDLNRHHESIREEIDDAIRRVIDANAFSGGPFVAEFERDFASFCGTEHAIGVGSGTEALWLALLAGGIGAGDEVITTPNTFIATAEAITYAGATPVFVDIEEATYNLDPARLEAAITPRTRAIIPVHLFGQPAAMDPILEIARRHRLLVIEDASQAHGAEYHGRRVGALGDLGCFSFYPGKNLGAFGEAGAVVTDRDDLAERIRLLRDHGRIAKYEHGIVGWNSRMDGIQGAVLRIKLRSLDSANDSRRAHAAEYHRRLAGIPGVIPPATADGVRHVWHLYVIRVAQRDGLMRHLTDSGIAAGIHYPVPLHRQKAYADLNLPPGSFPVAEQCSHEFVSLPIFPELAPGQISHVTTAVQTWIE